MDQRVDLYIRYIIVLKTLNCMLQLRAFCTAIYSCQCNLFGSIKAKMNMFITEA